MVYDWVYDGYQAHGGGAGHYFNLVDIGCGPGQGRGPLHLVSPDRNQ